jgi:hypothetical protein
MMTIRAPDRDKILALRVPAKGRSVAIGFRMPEENRHTSCAESIV